MNGPIRITFEHLPYVIGYMMTGAFSFLLFVNDLPYALKALMLLFAGDVEMVVRRTLNMNLHSPLTVALDW